MGNPAGPLSEQEVEDLRREHYNATITHVQQVNDRLVRVRVRLDGGTRLAYEPGQYTTLGLGYWERRLELAQSESLDEKQVRRVVKRAYSISCRLLDHRGEVAPVGDDLETEFYVALVTEADKPPAFTPRLFLLGVGDRLQMNPRAKGHFTLGDPDAGGVRPEHNVLLASTGTGEAPHNAMLARLLAEHHVGRIASVCCVRYDTDLGYLDEHRRLMERYPNYRYAPLTTREARNRDPGHPDYVGVRYVQDLLEASDAADTLGFALDPATTRVFLCGNPAMIGVPNRSTDPEGRYPKPRGAVEALEGMGFRADEPRSQAGAAPGNIHYEKYW